MIRVPSNISIPEHYFLKTADVVVERVGDGAKAVDRHGNIIAESDDHVYVWQKAVDIAPEHRVVVGLGEFTFDKGVSIKKPLTIIGGKFIRDPSIGSSSHAFFSVGNGKGEPIIDGPVRFINCYFDGNERNITGEYTEGSNAPVHDGILVAKIRKFYVEGCVFKDMARSALWVTCIECQEGVIDHEEINVVNNYFENVGYGICAEAYRKLVVTGNTLIGLNAGSEGASYGNPNYFISLNYLNVEKTIIANNIIDGEVPSGYPYAGSRGFTSVIKGGGTTNFRTIISGNIITRLKVGIFTWGIRGIVTNNYIYDVNIGIDAWTVKESIISNNIIRKFTSIGLRGTGSSEIARFEHNIIVNNYIDPEDETPSYGMYIWDYAKHNIITGNVIANKSYGTSWVKIWLATNISDIGVYDTTSLTTLQNEITNDLFPLAPWIPLILYYDGTYYYLVHIDLKNKVMRKVQVS